MKKISILFVSALLVVALIAGGLNLSSAFAQTQNQQANNGDRSRTIQVSGVGSASAQPDTAYVVVGVRTEDEEASAALDENSQQVTDLIDALQQTGIAEADIQTLFINLSPRYSDQPTQAGQPQVTGYIATNTVQVRIRDIDAVGQILDAAVQAGSNLIENIRFEVSDQEEVQQQAREAAFTNAQQKAEQLADLAGVELGELVAITELSGGVPLPYAAGGAMAAQDMAVPVEPGSQSVLVSLQVTWEITGGQVGVPQTGNTATVTPVAGGTSTPTSVATATSRATATNVATATSVVTATTVATATSPAGNTATATPVSTQDNGDDDATAIPIASPTAVEGTGSTAADQLRAQGAAVRQVGTIQQPFFPVVGQLIEVNREQVQVFKFESAADARQAASAINQTGNQLSGLITAHFFQDDDTVVLYTGNNAEVLALLSDTFGNALTN